MKNTNVPGPGSYEYKDKKSSRAIIIGTSKRGDIVDMKHANNVPGPGNYSVIDERDESLS
jgi:Sperm-tail PG-rich repeat